MGAQVWHRDYFLDTLEKAIEAATLADSWTMRFKQWNASQINNGVE
jgi:hypothetical protein